MQRKNKYKQLTFESRKLIERYLDEGKSFSRIALDLDVSPSTVHREVKRNKRFEGVSKSRSAEANDCAHSKRCRNKYLCTTSFVPTHKCSKRLCKRCDIHDCIDLCESYEKRVCKTTSTSPLVCNSCAHFSRCKLERYRYCAKSAQVSTRERNSLSRQGFDLSEAEVKYLVRVVREGFKKGQSVHHIFCSNEMPCSERTFYRLVENQSIPIIGIELAKKKKYKVRKSAKRSPLRQKGFYKGREYKDFLDLPLSKRSVVTEVDTIWGTKRDTKCILSLHRVDLHFQIYLLLSVRSADEVVKALDWLEMCAGVRFAEFFGLLLADRGSEFDKYADIERSLFCPHVQRTSIYYADPSRPSQRGSGEKNHVEFRKVVPKGTSLENMTPSVLAEITSHVNSTIRLGCGDTTPMQLAQMCLPRELLESLGLSLISPNEVISAPGILYKP